MSDILQTWIVSAEEGTIRDSYRATGAREAAVVAAKDMIRHAQPGDRIEICVWQEDDETVEVFFATVPAGGEEIELIGMQEEGYESARDAMEAAIARRID